MSNDLITVATFATPAESDVARAALASEGIYTSVDGEATLTWFWQLSNAAGGVKLQVPSDDAGRARQVLAEGAEHAAEQDVDLPTWKCPSCYTEVAADMDICWSCGTSEDGNRNPDFVSADAYRVSTQNVDKTIERGGPVPAWFAFLMIVFPPLLVTYAITTLLFRRRACEDGVPPDLKHEEIESSDAGEADTDDELTPDEKKADELITRAWRAAVFSIGFLPILLNAYAVWVLFQYSGLDEKARRRTRGRYRTTIVINLAAFAFWCSLMTVAFWPALHVSEDIWPHDVSEPAYVEDVITIPVVPGY